MTLSLNANAPLDGVQAPIIGSVDPEETKPTDHDRANGIDIFSDGGETVETLTSAVESFIRFNQLQRQGLSASQAQAQSGADFGDLSPSTESVTKRIKEAMARAWAWVRKMFAKIKDWLSKKKGKKETTKEDVQELKDKVVEVDKKVAQMDPTVAKANIPLQLTNDVRKERQTASAEVVNFVLKVRGFLNGLEKNRRMADIYGRGESIPAMRVMLTGVKEAVDKYAEAFGIFNDAKRADMGKIEAIFKAVDEGQLKHGLSMYKSALRDIKVGPFRTGSLTDTTTTLRNLTYAATDNVEKYFSQVSPLRENVLGFTRLEGFMESRGDMGKMVELEARHDADRACQLYLSLVTRTSKLLKTLAEVREITDVPIQLGLAPAEMLYALAVQMHAASGFDADVDGLSVENFFNPEGMEESGIAEHHQFATEEDDRQYEKIAFAVESFSQLHASVKADGMSVQAANEAVAINPDIGLRKAHMYTTVPSGTLLAPSLEAFSEQIKNFLQKLLGWISKAWKKLKEKANSIFKRDHAKKSEETDAKMEELDGKLQSEGKREEDVVTEAVKQAETKGPEAKKAATGKEKQLIEMAQAVVNKSQTNPWVAHALGTLRVVDVIRQMSAVAGEVQSVISGSVGNIRPGSANKLNDAAAKLVSSRFFTMGNSLNVAKTEAVPNKDTISSVRDAVAIFTLLRKNRDQQSRSIEAVINNLQSVNNSIAESDKALDSLENLNNLGDFDDSERAAVKTFTDSIKQAGSHLNDILDFVHAISMINEQLLRYGNLMLGAMFGTDEGTGNESIDIPGLELLGWVSAAESQVNNIFDYFGDLDEAAFEQELEHDRMEMDPGIPASESYDSAGPLGVGDNPTSFNMDAIRNVRGVEALEAFDGAIAGVKKAIEWIRKKVYAMVKKIREWYSKVRYGNSDAANRNVERLKKMVEKPNPKIENDEQVVSKVQSRVKNAYRLMTMTAITATQGSDTAKDLFDAVLRSYAALLREIKNVVNSNNGLGDALDRITPLKEDFATVWASTVKAGKEPVKLADGVYEPIRKLIKDNEDAQKIIPSNLDIGSIVKQGEDVVKMIDDMVGKDESDKGLALLRMSSGILSICSSLTHTLAAQKTGMEAPAFFLIKTLKKQKLAFGNESYDNEGEDDDYEDDEDLEEDRINSNESSLHDQSEGKFSDVPRALRGIPREPVEDEPRRIEESSGLLGTPYGASAVYAQYP